MKSFHSAQELRAGEDENGTIPGKYPEIVPFRLKVEGLCDEARGVCAKVEGSLSEAEV